jgi:uncharacterized delta-60 repeat protein
MQKNYIFHHFLFVLLPMMSHLTSAAQGIDTTFKAGSGANDQIMEVLQQSDGKILIGGLFTLYKGQTANRIARLNGDGSLDTSFQVGTGANFNVYTLALQADGKILVGGDFTSFNDVAVKRIVRLHPNGSLDTTFRVTRNPNAGFYAGGNSKIFKLAQLPDGKIMVAGCFNNFDGSSTTRFARLHADGRVDASFSSSFSPFALTFAVQSDGKLIGCFQGSGLIVRLNTDGSIDHTFAIGSGASGWVYDFIVQEDDKILVGGGFTSFNGFPYRCLVRLHGNGSVDTSFRPGSGPNNTVIRVKRLSNRKYVIGGNFRSYDSNSANSVARLEEDGTLEPGFNQSGSGVNADIRSLAEVAPERFLLVGNFTSFDGRPANRIIQVRSNYPGPEPPTITPGGALQFCQGDSVTLSVPASFAGYRWSNGSTTPLVKIKTSGSYSLQVKNTHTDWSSASVPIVVTVHPLPVQPTITPLGSFQVGIDTLSSSGTASHYRWEKDGVALPQDAPKIRLTASGSYRLRLENQAGCLSAFSSPYTFIITGLEPVSDNLGLIIYPNPARHTLFVGHSSALPVSEIRLLNSMGNLCRQFNRVSSSTPLSLEGLTAGVYVAQIRIGAALIRRKVVLQP